MTHLPEERRAEGASDDPWQELRKYTQARIAIGRAGTSLPTTEVLRFAAAHAQARDAVHVALDVEAIQRDLRAIGLQTIAVRSSATDRADYLLRPDRGRVLDSTSDETLRRVGCSSDPDLVVVVADGLSALATQRHAVAVVSVLADLLRNEPAIPIGPIVVATQARVALADQIGEILRGRLVLILLGERPGLAAPDSLGAYLTSAPRPRRTDAERNCVSNIRPEGQPPAAAAARLAWLIRTALRCGVTGIGLKDDSDAPLIAPTVKPPRVEKPSPRSS